MRRLLSVFVGLLCVGALLTGCSNENPDIFPPAKTTASQITHVAVPKDLRVSTESGNISLYWSPVEQAEGYQIFRLNSELATYDLLEDTISTFITFTDGKAGESYSYYVKAYAFNDSGRCLSEPSDTVRVTLTFGAVSAPTYFSVTPGAEKASLVWSAVDGAEGYDVYMQTGTDGEYQRMAQTKSTSVSISGLTGDTAYSFYVQAYATDPETKEIIYGQQSAQKPATPSEIQMLQPHGLKAEAQDRAAKLSWNAVEGATGYVVYRRNTGEKDATAVGQSETTEFLATDLKNGHAYSFYVQAVKTNDTGTVYSPASISVDVTPKVMPLAVPTGVTAQGGDGSVTLKWNAVAEAVSYQIYRYDTETKTYISQRTLKGATKTTITGLKNGTRYGYAVKACASANGVNRASDYSEVVYATPVQPLQGTTAPPVTTAAPTRTTAKPTHTTAKPPVTTTTPPTTQPPQSNDARAEVLRLINEERAKHGLSALTMTDSLTQAANVRAKEIIGTFSHTRPDGTSCFTVLAQLGISYRTAGENIAIGYATPAKVMESWMNSDGHRANILSAKFTKVGIGYDPTAKAWTQMFIG